MEYKNIERVLKEQVIIEEISEEIEIKDNKEISASSLQNPADSDATYRTKAGKSHQGYVVNITETCNKDNEIQLITKCSIEKNITSDKELFLQDIEGSEAKVMIADGAYNTKETIEKSEELEIELICTNLTGRREAEETNVAFFELDENQGIVKCPNGCTPVKTKYNEENETYTGHFDKGECAECPQRANCAAREQKKLNVVNITKTRKRNSELIEYMKTKEFLETKNLRPAIEGTISGLKRGQGLGTVLTYGLSRVSYFVMFKVIGCNFKRVKRAIDKLFFDKIFNKYLKKLVDELIIITQRLVMLPKKPVFAV